MIGTQNNLYELDNSREASFCQVDTRTGRIVIGLSGRDHYQAPIGFWKRLGGYLGIGGEGSAASSEKGFSDWGEVVSENFVEQLVAALFSAR